MKWIFVMAVELTLATCFVVFDIGASQTAQSGGDNSFFRAGGPLTWEGDDTCCAVLHMLLQVRPLHAGRLRLPSRRSGATQARGGHV